MTGTASQQAQPSPAPVVVDPNADRLAQFRERQASSGFTEGVEPAAPGEIQSRTAPPPEPAPAEPEMPRLRVDPRDAIAARSRAARAARNPDGHTAPADRFNIPQGIPVEGDEDEAARAAEEAEATRAPVAPQAERRPAPPAAAPSADGRFTLRVDGNDFSVSREELLRYAEVEPDEAPDYSEISLVKLAQKHLAASSRLEAAKAEAKAARATTPRTPQATIPGQDESTADATDQPGEQLHQLSDKQLIEKVQFGDADEALAATQLLNQRQFERMSLGERLKEINGEIGTTINSFGEKNADIASDGFLQSAHRATLVDMVVDEIAANAPGMTPNQVAQLKANPNLAMDAYKAARLDGLNVRKPAELFDAAANTVRTRFGRPTPQREEQRDNPPPAQSRTEAKRGLLAQPRPESASMGAPQAAPRRQTASEVVRARFGNRMNRG